MKFDLIFALKAKSVLVNKGATSLNLIHPLMILALALSVLSSPIPDVLTKFTKNFDNFNRLVILNSLCGNYSTLSGADLHIS